jgi:hypothetical protein
MTTPPVDLPPLTTEQEVLARIGTIVTPVCAQRLWLLFVDGDGRQAPAVVPISGLPLRPDRHLVGLAKILGGLRHELHNDRSGGAVILAWERPGGDEVLPADHEWAEALIGICRTADVPLRGVYLRTPGDVQRLG